MGAAENSRRSPVPVREKLKKILAVFGLTVLCLAVFEISCRAILMVTARTESTPEVVRRDPRADLPAYEDATYDVDLLMEEERSLRKSVYRPFVVWSRQTIDGQLINIDAEGHRANHFNSDREDALQLWMMGGSTMWGQGAPDTETIPSYAARILNEQLGLDVNVRNLGEIGYVSTQEIVSLIRELQLGRRPDFVIFFDGVNDAPAAALWPETPGTHMNYYRIRDRFEAPGRRRKNVLQTVIRNSGVVRFSAFLREKMGVTTDNYLGAWNAPDTEAEFRERGEAAARLWLDNFQMIQVLGRAYGFVPIAVLQPSLMVGEKPLHPSEKALEITEMENEAKRTGMAVFAEMRRAVRELLPQKGLGFAIHDESDLFADFPDPVYIDYVHMSGRGNRVIAERLIEILQPYLCAENPPRVGEHAAAQLRAWCR